MQVLYSFSLVEMETIWLDQGAKVDKPWGKSINSINEQFYLKIIKISVKTTESMLQTEAFVELTTNDKFRQMNNIVSV